MSNLIASITRFSTAMTLFGVEQMEKTMNAFGGGAEFSKTVEDFEKTLNSLTDVLTGKMDKKMRETLQSVTKMTEDTVNRTLDVMEVADPREVLKASTDLLQKTSETTSEWVSRTASAVEKATTGAAKSKDAEHAKTH
ncbi:MAG: phasin family protein [Acidobacteria bacterium]|nr:phasin family protein [Acidobacteriota bacterium]